MRLIDAGALYTELMRDWDTMDPEEFEKAVFRRLTNAPTIGGWITCSERLPEPRNEMVRRDVYLVTVKEGLVFTCAFVFDTRGGYWENGLDVIAWQRLPEPYREDGEDE